VWRSAQLGVPHVDVMAGDTCSSSADGLAGAGMRGLQAPGRERAVREPLDIAAVDRRPAIPGWPGKVKRC